MKRLLSILLLCPLLLGALSSCGGGTQEETTTPGYVEVVTVPPTVTLGDGTDYGLLLNSALDFTEDDANFTYELCENEVTVTGYRGEKKRISIPASIEGKPVTAIEEGSFAGEKQLTAVRIPTTVRRIGEGILTGCSSLEVLETPLLGASPDATQYLGYLFGADTHEDNPKDVPATLKYLSLVGLTALPDYALFDCNDLVAIQMDDVCSVGKYALYHCTSLKYLSSVSGLTSVSAYAFDSCSSLLRLDFGNGLTEMGFGALQGCAALQELTLPFVGGSPTENNYIGYVFGAETPDFTAGFYPAALESIILTEACTVLGDYAFYECSSLKQIVLPQALTAVGVRAFSGCSKLFEVSLGERVQQIGASAFSGCTALYRLSFAEGLEQMGINAFYGCRSLCELTLPQSLAALPSSAFAECVSLKSVSLGGVRSVGANAFYRCARLEQVTADGTVHFEKGNEAAQNAMSQNG